MAWIFELAIECGPEQTATRGLQVHFHELAFHAPDGRHGRFTVLDGNISKDEDGGWWVSVVPIFEDGRAAQESEDPRVLGSIAEVLYERLKSAPGYRFALVGVEVSQFSTLRDLHELTDRAALPGLVLQKETHSSLQNPAGFEVFSPGYFWLPFIWKPE